MITNINKNSFKVAVIGGGVVGSSIAYHLSQMGLKDVVVIEKDSTYKNASAMLSAGGIRQQFSVKENVLMSKYGIEFLKHPQLLQINDNIPNYQFHENGYLFLASSSNGLSSLQKNNQLYHDSSISWIKLVTSSELQIKFPWIHVSDILGGSFGEINEGYFDPWSLLVALKNKACANGVVYKEGKVEDISLNQSQTNTNNSNCIHKTQIKSVFISNTTTNSNSSNTSIANNHTSIPKSLEEIKADIFINACGPWAGNFIDMVSSKSIQPSLISKLPVKARKRSIFMFHCKQFEHEYSPHTPLVVDPSGIWFRSEGNKGNFICGMSPLDTMIDDDCNSEKDLDIIDDQVFNDYIWPILYNRVPAFGDLKVKSSWAGFYEYNTFDQNAIIGNHPDVSNLLLCNGFSGHGLQQSPAAGRAISELVVYGNFKTLDLTRFSFDRILNNKPIYEEGIV